MFTIPLERIVHDAHFRGCNAHKYIQSRNITRIHKQKQNIISRYSCFRHIRIFCISLLKFLITLSAPPHQFYNMEELKIHVFSFRIRYHFTLIKCFSVEEVALYQCQVPGTDIMPPRCLSILDNYLSQNEAL